MERLWAPWRSEYLNCVSKSEDKNGCLFCWLKRRRDDRKNLILYRDKRVFVVMNRYPYNSGHLMVAPLRHVASFEGLTAKEGEDLFRLVQMSIKFLRQEFCPQGFNFGANLGDVAGAGVPGHLHLHIVPRWQGDTNFMPVCAETKVVSEGLEKTYERLKRHFAMLK